MYSTWVTYWVCLLPSVTRRSGTIHTSSGRSGECYECTGTCRTRLRNVCTHAFNMGGKLSIFVAHCCTLFLHHTDVIHDLWGMLGGHRNAQNTSQKSVDTCTQHGPCIECIGYTVLHVIPALYTRRPRRMGSARSALEYAEHVSEEGGHRYSTWVIY